VIVWHLLADPTARFHDLSADGDDRFDEHRPGLDYLSFRVIDRAELKAWQARLEALGIPHGEIVDATTARGCPSATPTTSSKSSSRRPDRSQRRPTGRDRPAGSVADSVATRGQEVLLVTAGMAA
jgi:hypothetical protein